MPAGGLTPRGFHFAEREINHHPQPAGMSAAVTIRQGKVQAHALRVGLEVGEREVGSAQTLVNPLAIEKFRIPLSGFEHAPILFGRGGVHVAKCCSDSRNDSPKHPA